MILQNKDGENKLFIDDEVIEKFLDYSTDEYVAFHCDKIMNILFKEENILVSANDIFYHFDEDHIILSLLNQEIMEKAITQDEQVSFSLFNDTLVIATFKLPIFMTGEYINDNFPKFEVNISDCFYNMKIYLNDAEYINIPYYHSHNNINDTINHIRDVVYYITEENSSFINTLSNKERMEVSVYNKERECIGCKVYEYKMSDEGIVLLDDDFNNGQCLVEWQKLFRLVIDKTWEIDFDIE